MPDWGTTFATFHNVAWPLTGFEATLKGGIIM